MFLNHTKCSLSLLLYREKVDESSEEVRIKFVDELFRTETKEHSLTNGDTPDDQG